jgi:hypothetical protein
MHRIGRSLFLLSIFGATALLAQDVMTFANGEKLVGKLVRSSGMSVTFKSDSIGEVTVDWSKISQLETKEAFAVLPKNVVFKRNADTSAIPEGTVTVADQKITVGSRTIPVTDADRLVEKGAFDAALARNPRFFSDWGGTVTAGASLVEATQQSRAFNAAVNLVRISPDEDWLARRNRTTVQFSTAYGTLRQPATPLVKTDIFHAGIERDEYISSSWFGFGQAVFDHSYSQGLSLQQAYGGGLGWSAISRPNESLDFKASMTYVRQSFTAIKTEQSLIGTAFEEDFSRGLRRGIQFTQQLIVIPAWNNSDALSATGNALLSLPVYKRMNFSLGASDAYLHDPPVGFKKNSFQATMGLTYSLR